MRAALHLIADSLLAVTFAPRCAACAGVLDEPRRGPVCAACWGLVRALPPFAGEAATASLSCWRAAGEYEGALRQIIHAFKYDDRRSLARPLGRLMREAGRDVLDGAACVVPVPLHPWRHFRRGFNQAALLAAALERPVVPALWRTRRTRPQAGLDKGTRQRNVHGAFRRSPLLSRATDARCLAGRVVVLVDDVRTTGATLEACARVLLDAGAGEVRAVTASVAR
jgi:ComF family protein